MQNSLSKLGLKLKRKTMARLIGLILLLTAFLAAGISSASAFRTQEPFSPWIIFRSYRDGYPRYFWLYPNSRSTHPLGEMTASDDPLQYSPDGGWILSELAGEANVGIHRIRPNGLSQQALTPNAVDDFQPRWSPDGQWILFMS